MLAGGLRPEPPWRGASLYTPCACIAWDQSRRPVRLNRYDRRGGTAVREPILPLACRVAPTGSAWGTFAGPPGEAQARQIRP